MLTIKNNAQTRNFLEKRIQTNSGANRAQEIREGRLVIQPDITDNAAINRTPMKINGVRNNLINNRLILKTTKKLAVEPHLKKKTMRKRPVEKIYRDRVITNVINPDYPDSQYDPYFNAYMSNYYSGLDLYPRNPYSNNRFPYWKPLWQQFNDPYIRTYDMRVLVPITNKNLGLFATSSDSAVRSSNSSERTKSTSKLNMSDKYAPFSDAEPIPIIVKRKEPSLNLVDEDSNKKTRENFRLPSTYRHQNRVHRVNHIRGSTRGMSNRHINSPTRSMRHYRHPGRRRIIKNTTNYYGGSSGSYWGGSPYYIGPYGYYPFTQYYDYDTTNVLPLDLNSALLPVYDYNVNPIIKKIKKDKSSVSVSVKSNIENFENDSETEYFSEKEVPIPTGYKLVVFRFIEVRKLPNDNVRSNIIFLILLIIVLGYFITKNSSQNK